ncbi:hypothetical protein EV200_11133 [Pedobacter psychrotolerans]|uniref:Cbb3-type cytochrome oxidase component FixQ n=1 Tax=Pedobacter psychrotolerans TaxID=1843235 RepID=A0A4R2H1W2_9SPHI|nr:hypothetical protein [Pedobacter psychrotolerans]TCO18696.1 hypothetical protein EV200_11133 [Pedobacter psychrotolerans]GGE70102.1 hypothetical protein GCM10011413_40930 [Pedobacter psychrotolerans]
MFNQIKDLAGGELYLISSLIMFMVFFIIVGIYLLKLNKKHIEVMSELPIKENQSKGYEEN